MDIVLLLKFLDSLIWCPCLIVLLIFIGCYFTYKLHFIQIRYLKTALQCIIKKENSHQKGISPLASLCTALSATIGTGNIVGMATAVTTGGPGALFWMSIAAFLGMATKYAESLLAVKYRTTDEKGQACGGPMYTIEKALGMRWLAHCFAAFGVGVALLGIGTFGQIKSITDSAKMFSLSVPVTTTLTTILVAIITLGGINRIAKAAERIVPTMCIAYLFCAFVILILHIDRLGEALSEIVIGAFCPKAVLGGTLSISLMKVIQTGIARGIYSNESGLGSAPIAAAAAQTSSAQRQGLISMTGTFFSLVICLVTGLVLIVMKPYIGPVETESLLTAQAFEAGFYGGKAIVNVGVIFFAFTTILGWNYYGEVCIQYLFKGKSVLPYRVFFLILIAIGPFLNLETIFVVADIVNGLMAVPNLISLWLLRKEITPIKKAMLG